MKVAVAFAVVLAACSSCRREGAVVLPVAGSARHYDVFAPPGLPAGRPLVIVLHGNGGTGQKIRKLTHFDKLATRESFVVAYPDAIDHHWNDGRPEIASASDDIGFIATLIEELSARYAIDRARVYVTGISNGGIMSYRLACELGDRIAAIAPVAGQLADVPPCALKAPVSVLAINGTADPIMPFDGGEVARHRGHVHSALDSTAYFARREGCSVARTSEALPDLDPGDDTRSERTRYTECPRGIAVELITVENGGHTWPGGAQYLPRSAIGATARDFDGTEVIWAFFAAHPHA
ncbi:MAG TPA: PHB depolymerase family esterase [Kofleriaceae bacterium]|nr:PHB depolymerase family esterase [Kofleriaceae bacterium]